uniref:PAZ domain-containing protein n=2 Tax=Meloidogyne incognita TaxID=6306 RepID=A0A914NC94_MELIC
MQNLSNETNLDILKCLDFDKLCIVRQTNCHFNALVEDYKKELARNTLSPIPLVNYMANFMGIPLDRLDDSKIIITDKQYDNFSKGINGIIIKITHFGQRGKEYRVIEVPHLSAQKLTFPYQAYHSTQTSQRSVAQHFIKQYKKHLRFPNLPCVRVEHKLQHMYFPVEVCDIVPGQRGLL